MTTPDERTKWFQSYVKALEESVIAPAKDGHAYNCPCCGCKTLGERGGFEICPICYWEDDGQDNRDADVVRGGPNGRLSLTHARANFIEFGACEKRHITNVRKPLPDELL